MYFTNAPGANEHGVLAQEDSRAEYISAGDLDSYSFTASEGEGISLAVSGSLTLWMELYAPDGRNIANASGNIVQNSLPQSGSYTVVIRSYLAHRTGSYTLQYSLTKNLLSYAALGDSFSSGEGVFPGEFGYKSACNRSSLAYPTYIKTPQTIVPIAYREDSIFDFYACTGAETIHVQAAGEGLYGEPPQAVSTQVDATRDLITITIGGNDALFGWILKYCLAHNHCNDLKPFDPHTDVELGELYFLWIPVIKQRLLATLSEVKAKASNATILVMDYPLVVSGNECDRAQLSSDVKLSADEQSWMRDANRALNQAVKEAALEVGMHFVSVEEHFEGHGVCGDDGEWMFGTWHFWPQGMFHPNHLGQWEYAVVINRYLNAISSDWSAGYFASGLPRNPAPVLAPAPAPVASLPVLVDLNVVSATVPIGCEDLPEVLVPGQDYVVGASGFAANDAIALSMRVAGQTIELGVVSANGQGNFETTVTIPSSISVETSASLEALGAGSNNRGRLALVMLEMAASVDFDSDGDGIPDGCDNCASLANANQQDQDFDGRGDVCDACVFEAINDQDGDGLCASEDICPLDIDNDVDADGLCLLEDNCPLTANPDQIDTDGDLIGGACDIDDTDPNIL